MLQNLIINKKLFIIIKTKKITDIENFTVKNNNINIKLNNRDFNIKFSSSIEEIILIDENEFQKGDKALMILIKRK